MYNYTLRLDFKFVLEQSCQEYKSYCYVLYEMYVYTRLLYEDECNLLNFWSIL